MVKFPYWVIPRTLAGSSMPTDEEAVASWYRMGIRSVVVLVEAWEFAMEGWDLVEYMGVLRKLGMNYLHVPVKDGYAPREEKLHEIASWIEGEVASGKPVLVHCHAGVGRSPTAIAAYLMYKEGLSADDALDRVGRVNDALSITNEQYITLISFEQLLKNLRRIT